MQKPDFSGEWTLNLEASALSPVVAPVVQSGFVRIEHLEPSVSVHLSITMDGKPFDVRFTRPSNWDGDALVFIDRVQTPNSEMTISFRYDLQDSGPSPSRGGGATRCRPRAGQRVGLRPRTGAVTRARLRLR